MGDLRALVECGGLRLHEFRCDARVDETARDELARAHEIALPRRGMFVRRRGRDEEVADPGRCLYFRRDEPYRVTHPRGGGDVCTVVSLSEAGLRDLAGASPFTRGHAPVPARVEMLHRRLLHALRDDPRDRLAIEECLHVLAAALVRLSRTGSAGAARAGGAARRSLARAAQEIVAARFREPLSLLELAATLGCSPFHLCRAFRDEAGVTLHRHAIGLRLRAALEALLDGARDLTALALELGFSDHAHFTRSFRREFGRTPSSCRTRADADELRALSKIVQAGGSGAN